jgi:hypothetical protein
LRLTLVKFGPFSGEAMKAKKAAKASGGTKRLKKVALKPVRNLKETTPILLPVDGIKGETTHPQ